MRIYPAVHYTMGGLWVDYNLMSTIPGLHVLGEANFSDHGANRLGASALMQGLADGYFVIPAPSATTSPGRRCPVTTDHDAFKEAEDGRSAHRRRMLAIKGKRTVELPPRAGPHAVGLRAAWPATRPGLRRRSTQIPSCARSSGRTSRSRRAERR